MRRKAQHGRLGGCYPMCAGVLNNLNTGSHITALIIINQEASTQEGQGLPASTLPLPSFLNRTHPLCSVRVECKCTGWW